MEKNFQLIALDMDGTLLTSDKKIMPETARALRQVSDRSVHVVLSTGRGLAELTDYMDRLDFISYGILVSGALVYDFGRKTALSVCPMEKALADDLLGRVREAAPMVQILTDRGTWFQEDQYREIEAFGIGMYRDMYGRVASLCEDIYALYPFLPVIGKIILYHRSVEERDRDLERIRDLPVQISFAEETSLEITAAGVSKARGFEGLCRYLGVDPARTMAVGDSWNDLEILEAAGLSVAMGNALPQVKDLCGAVVADNDHDGVGEAVREFLL